MSGRNQVHFFRFSCLGVYLGNERLVLLFPEFL